MLETAVLVSLINAGYDSEVSSYIAHKAIPDDQKVILFEALKSKAVKNIDAWFNDADGNLDYVADKEQELIDDKKNGILDEYEILGVFSAGIGGGDEIEDGYFVRLQSGVFAVIAKNDISIGDMLTYKKYGENFIDFVKSLASDNTMVEALLHGKKPKNPESSGGTIDYNYLHWWFEGAQEQVEQALTEAQS